MEAQPRPDGRTKLLLYRRKDRLIDLSLLNALYRGPTGEDAIRRFRNTVGITCGEARSLNPDYSRSRVLLMNKGNSVLSVSS